ncbi:hypothetical protein ASPCAL08351 [Aspergillus calidoustus]|uniref:Zn(2)-C6 fungal-type domain-containing protein n=1 Tax=Aspergillus calidoustus TaxID=454130 RepID=A0A0U5GPY4_ASPCI|nr:hypothetical protein ASPCAL08351 [Aspergillus calidoustus]
MQEHHDSPQKPSSVACVPCRRRHLRCDALMPVCTRCQTAGTECHYVRSRRGRRDQSRRVSSRPDEEGSSVSADAFSDWLNATAFSPDLNILTTHDLFQPLDLQTYQNFPLPTDTVDTFETPLTSRATAHEPMIQLYYQYFHPSHPFIVPRRALNSPAAHLIPAYLIAVMRYIGAHYYPDQSLKQALRQPAYSFLADPSLRDGFTVQALLLLAIIDHSSCQEQSAHRLLQMAVNLALEIGLHHACFALEQSYGHPVLEESWRRTYWELYIVDGLLAAMREQSPFRLYRQGASVLLPCAEKMYTSNSARPSGQTLDDLQNDWTLAQNFSTFTYRIDAVRNLGAVLELNRSLEANIEARVETIDAHLCSSLMTLPALHGDGYDSSCHDEMVFQAQMTLYLALIYLHHPRSSMRFASFHNTTENPPSPSSTSCTRLKLPESHPQLQSKTPSHPSASISATLTQPPSPTLDIHSHKLLRAADLLSNLATLPSTIQNRSPFFTCALAMCIIVHTAALLVVGGSTRQESLKARVQLSIGALKVLGRVWPLAKRVRGEMVGMYREVVGG